MQIQLQMVKMHFYWCTKTNQSQIFFLFSSKIAMLLLKDLGVTIQTIRSPPHPCPTAVQTDAGNELQPDPNLWQ